MGDRYGDASESDSEDGAAELPPPPGYDVPSVPLGQGQGVEWEQEEEKVLQQRKEEEIALQPLLKLTPKKKKEKLSLAERRRKGHLKLKKKTSASAGSDDGKKKLSPFGFAGMKNELAKMQDEDG